MSAEVAIVLFVVVVVITRLRVRRRRKQREIEEIWRILEEDRHDRDRVASPTGVPRGTWRPVPASQTDMPASPQPVAVPCPEEPVRRVLKGKAWVVDGDRIDVAGVRLRLFGIDAPELDHPNGIHAKRAMMRLCRGQIVSAEVVDEDRYGRTVAKCHLSDGRDLSAELVKEGLALDWPRFSGGCYAHLEVPGVRRKLWLAAARQKGHMHVWKDYEARKAQRAQKSS